MTPQARPQAAQERRRSPAGPPTPPARWAFAVGDVVQFTGNTHYTSAAGGKRESL